MIRQYELIEKIRQYNPDADIAFINRAYIYSMKAHGNQRRASGEPYLVHPLQVAAILADLQLDDVTIVVGLLHDTLEDTLTSYDELKELFGQDVADLTDGVSKLSRVQFNDKATEQAENFRKLLLAMADDIRVLLVKLADRLHNMRTLHHISKPEKRQRIASETMDIFAPLADRIGLYSIKSELEDLAFAELDPQNYEKLSIRMEEWRNQDDLVDRVIEHMEAELKSAGIEARVQGREKTIYSTWRKMQRKNLAFDQLTDIIAYRVVVPTKRDCYNVLGLIHDVYRAIPGRFKDYISAPKPNGYQSLHTSVIGPFGNRMEVQIRTEEMHAIAEAGVAAHWVYKEGGADLTAEIKEGRQYAWLRQLVEHLKGLEDPEEFYSNAKLELFSENVFVFTPKGDLIALPQGATPLDFAYYVHTDVGHRCQAARLNGHIVPLRTPLSNGDLVEVVTSKSQKPNPSWREFVVTARAKSAINRYLRGQQRTDQLRLGREMLEKTARREGYTMPTEKQVAAIATRFKLENAEDIYLALAQGRLLPRQVLAILYPAPATTTKPQDADADAVDYLPASKAESEGIGVGGLVAGLDVKMARCCNPIPGEPIVGLVTTGSGVSIHTKDCKNLEAYSHQPDRFLSVHWTPEALEDASLYNARLRLQVQHQPGTLSAVTTAVFNAGGNMTDVRVEQRRSDFYSIRCDVEVGNIDHMQSVLAALKSLHVVHQIERVKG